MNEVAQKPASVSDVARLTSLDGLRGVAAVVVVLCHSLLIVPTMAASIVDGAEPRAGSIEWVLLRTPFRLLTIGAGAVMIFFVLSGFVLTLGLIGRRMTLRSAAGYLGRRAVRLYLPVWAAIAVALGLAVAVPRDPSAASVWLASHLDPSGATVAKDALLLLGTSNLNSPLWSLTWEVWFSLLLPLLWVLFSVLAVRRWWPLAAVLCVAASAAADLPPVQDFLPLPFVTTGLLQYLPVFCLGMIFAVIFDDVRALYERMGATARTTAWIVVIALIGTPVWEPFTQSPPLVRGGYWVLSLLGATGLVVLATVSVGARRVLSSRQVMFFGKRSFSLYLVHEPIIVATALVIGAAAWWPWAAMLPLVLAVIVAVTMVFYRWVERPTIAASRAVGLAIAGKRTPRAVPAVTAGRVGA